ncbi:DsrE family protein [Bacteroides sp. 519]|uniref:DsrE family protein n=1 Tax=Bacteroides sp. 519 TaxID=2302937 RepID=UPI0013D4CC44|nr:DsrE family protein [Bacteroides sp. 519]NDV60732.1 DsrE family protein [Bacteroides sp. 519]
MDKLNILWTTDNKDTVFYMIAMYAINSKRHNWWKEVNIIIWGAGVKLAGNDTQIQSEIMEMLHQGITIEACKDCCDTFGVSGRLEKLGINVRYMGQALTEYIKADEKILTI